MKRIYRETYWIIEHDSYGTLVDWDTSYLKPRPKFSYTGYRNESILFYSLEKAKAALLNCRESGKPGMHAAYILKHTEKGYIKE